jgi:hypothetical protein
VVESKSRRLSGGEPLVMQRQKSLPLVDGTAYKYLENKIGF